MMLIEELIMENYPGLFRWQKPFLYFMDKSISSESYICMPNFNFGINYKTLDISPSTVTQNAPSTTFLRILVENENKMTGELILGYNKQLSEESLVKLFKLDLEVLYMVDTECKYYNRVEIMRKHTLDDLLYNK